MRWFAVVALLSCSGKTPDTGPLTTPDVDTDADADGPGDTEETDTDTDTDVDADTDVDTDVDTDTDTDTGPVGCGDIPTFADGLSPARTLHVDPGGSDATGDGSKGAPFATIEGAAAVAGPGDAILLSAGTHAPGQFVYDLRGTDGAPIWIGGAGGAVIAGGGEALHLIRAAYVVVHDLEVTGAADNGINVDDGGDYADETATHHVVFRDLDIHDVGGGGNQDCLKLSGLRDFVVMDSTFARCGGGGSGSGVDHVGCHRGLIARNTFTELSANAVQCKGGSTDLELRWNHLIDAGDRGFNMGGSTDLIYFRPPVDPSADNAEARDIRAIANLIEGSEAAMAFVGCVDCAALHNTIVDPDKWMFRILQETTSSGGTTFLPASGGVVQNNLVVFTRAAVSTDVNIGPDVDEDSFTWTTNLFYATDDPGGSAPVLPGTEVGTLAGVDPLLQADGSVGAGSPAVGAGTADPRVVGAYDGACYGDPPTIGAFAAP